MYLIKLKTVELVKCGFDIFITYLFKIHTKTAGLNKKQMPFKF